MSDRKYTHLGHPYYEELPPNTRIGMINDFVYMGQKRVGMEYLVYSSLRNVFDVQKIRPLTPGEKIKEYIDAGILYVFTKS